MHKLSCVTNNYFILIFLILIIIFFIGPPHASPSVIVAKIMEKLREHEREIVYPKGSSRVVIPTTKSMQSTDKNAKPQSNRFNKVAENILTKIR